MNITIDDTIIRKKLANLAALTTPEGIGPVMKEIGRKGLTFVKFGFRNEEDPYGNAWAAIKRPGKILRDTSRLYRSLSYKVDGRVVTIGTNVCYAPGHQFGNLSLNTTCKRKDKHPGKTKAKDEIVNPWGKKKTKKQLKKKASKSSLSGENNQPKVRIIKARPFLPLREKGLPETWVDAFNKILSRHIKGVLK